jgi:hypothetical protein
MAPSMTLGARKRVLAVATRLQPKELDAVDQAAGTESESVDALLGLLHLSQYAHWFRAQDVDLDVFLSLQEFDLEDVQVRGC